MLFSHSFRAASEVPRRPRSYNVPVQGKIFWAAFTVLGLAADLFLPLAWALAATLPIILFSWWLAYRSGWF